MITIEQVPQDVKDKVVAIFDKLGDRPKALLMNSTALAGQGFIYDVCLAGNLEEFLHELEENPKLAEEFHDYSNSNRRFYLKMAFEIYAQVQIERKLDEVLGSEPEK